MHKIRFSRQRRKLLNLSLMPLLCGLPVLHAQGDSMGIQKKPIPGSGELITVIGMGTWLTFDLDDSRHATRDARVKLMKKFFEMGGQVVDSSPMYGFSEEVVGYCLRRLGFPKSLFAATKVWVEGRRQGIVEMEESRGLWGVAHFDLMQIHNMLDWEVHLETLKEMKKQGRIRYIGITTSHGSRHDRMERVLAENDFDFVQFTYNVVDREAEKRLLPLAGEKGIAVIANRPFRRGELFRLTANKALPKWTSEFDCHNWAQFFLKYIVSHPQISCAIPATSQITHLVENMGAAHGRLPDATLRARMQDLIGAL